MLERGLHFPGHVDGSRGCRYLPIFQFATATGAARVPLTEDRESLEFPTFWVDVNVLVGSESVEVDA